MAQEKVVAGLNVLLPVDEEPPTLMSRAARLDTFDGKVIGFFNNTKDNVDQLLVAMQARLEATYRPKGVIHRSKNHFAAPAPLDLLRALHRECDAVIVAAGTCGSCTACSVQDGVALEMLGTPAATVCTESFRTAGESQARSLGMPDHPIVVIAHPLATLSRSEVDRQADRAWRQTVQCLLKA